MSEKLELQRKDSYITQSVSVMLLMLATVVFYGALHFVDFDLSGEDTWGHFFKAEELLNSIKEGNLFPIYSKNWYNGHQPFRHRAPISYYVIALQIMLAGGNIRKAYMLFLAVLYFIGGLPWTIWGNIQRRKIRGTLFAVSWFFMPGILKVFIAEGNTPQMMTTTFMPYLMLFVWLYTRKEKNWARWGIYISMILITLSHLMIAAIIGVSLFIYLLVDGITQHTWRRGTLTLAYMISGIATAGIWVIPAVLSKMNEDGGVGSGTIFYSPTQIILNPAYRFIEDYTAYYFGLFIVIICIFGILFSKNRRIAGFVTPVIVLILTSPTIYKLLSSIPLVKNMWVSRFAPVMYAVFFCALMEWTSIKKKYVALVYLLIIADIIPSFLTGFYIIRASQSAVEDASYLREITTHRASVMDLSRTGSYISYGIGNEDGVDNTFGWGYQGADTASNVMLLNEAMEYGNYLYVFDRSVELGDDAVMILKSAVLQYDHIFDEVNSAAGILGYQLVHESSTAWFFKREYPVEFGMVNDYYGIAIGKYAPEMTITYPSFTVGDSNYIDDYSFDDLYQYDSIFLSGFEYHNKAKAEELVTNLDHAGVRIVIDSTHMPANGITKNEEFLGVLDQRIEFTGHFPTLVFNGRSYVLGRFGEDDQSFTTGYISRIDNPLGTFYYNNRELVFCGQTDGLDNTYFVALNLMYFATSTQDDESVSIMDRILNISTTVLPLRRLVPIEVTHGDNTITIVSPEDNVNTTLACLDIFDSDQEFINSNNLLVVNEGTTVITMHYPHFALALATSVLGIIMFAVLLVLEKKFLLLRFE